MSYYEEKRKMNISLNSFILSKKGSSQELAILEIKYGLKFGFSKKQIMKALEPYIKIGAIEIIDETLVIK